MQKIVKKDNYNRKRQKTIWNAIVLMVHFLMELEDK